MLPNATNNNDNIANHNQRRYSLFGGPTNTASGSPSSLSKVLGIVGNATTSHPINQQGRQSLVRRSTAADTTQGSVCQRCKRFEVDLTNASDDLSATDAELKASRQVISLLQRQLELFRVEKEGLEKLIISQQRHTNKSDAFQHLHNNEPESLSAQNSYLLIDAASSACDNDVADSTDGTTKEKELGSTQKLLLNLIRTQLYAKDEEIVKLKFSLKETKNDKEQIAIQLHLLEEDNARLKSENSVLSENLTLRDQTIVSLSNEVFEQDSRSELGSSRRQSSAFESFGGVGQNSLVKAQRQIARLIDTLDAYKKTNELLSDNVMRLTDRCTEAEKAEIETRSQCQELEAKCCQIQSKLLSLLKEIEQSSKQQDVKGDNSDDATADTASTDSKRNQEVICSESVKLLIKRLLEDKSLDIPLSWKEGNRPKRDNNKKDDNKNNSCSKHECDELGFYIVNNDEDDKSSQGSYLFMRRSFHENQNLMTTRILLPDVEEGIEVGEQQDSFKISDNNNSNESCNVARQVSVDATKNDEPRWHTRWDNFIKDFDKVDLNKSKELKALLRSGVPQEYRCKVWKSLIDLRIGKERKQYGLDYYQSLIEPNRPQSSAKNTLNPSSKQIELDLLRTLPNNKHFETLDSPGTVRLRRVLTAYSEHNPKVGYCQGMNRLAAVALLVLPEEEAFWCLTTIIDNIMPKGYYNDLWLAHVDFSVMMDFVAIKMPNLNDHFKRNGIELSFFAWFLTIFVDGTPPALFLRLWDSFLYEGDKILFRVSLALLKMHENGLLQLNTSGAINDFLRSTVNMPINIDKFFDIAFDWINPLSTRSLRAKRQHNFQLMRARFENAGQPSRTPSPSNSTERRGSSKNEDSPFEDSSIISI